MHNFGTDDFDYNNVPWGGVRTTRLRDPLNAPKDPNPNADPDFNPNRNHRNLPKDGGDAELVYPFKAFGDTDNPIPLLKDQGGYTLFAERSHP